MVRRNQEKFFQNIVTEVNEGNMFVDSSVCFKAVRKKKNWSAPGPDCIVNFWWKKLSCVLDVITQTFRAMINDIGEIEEWFCRGRTSLVPKAWEWSEHNQRPITCLNT